MTAARAESASMNAVHAAVVQALDAHVPAGAPIAVALSGGRDSVVLFDALAQVAPARGHRLSAIHVHHGLSPNADAWQRFCTDMCAARRVAISIRAVDVGRTPRTSLEAEARRARYAALAEAATTDGVHCIGLAHHRDDQAETLLLQLLRGAGPHGLAGMAPARADSRGVTWWRPLLDTPRSAIDDYALAAGLRWIDDESNAQLRHLRNAVRHAVMPTLAQVFPNPSATLARAAAHQAEAAQIADDLAAIDACGISDGTSLDRFALAVLPPHRARNLLRWFLRQQGLPSPPAARLAAMVAQLRTLRGDSNVRVAHGGVELGIHRGRVALHAGRPPAFDVRWRGESELALPHGRLMFARTDGAGIDEQAMAGGPIHVRLRIGGERLQLAPNRPRRALKSILQDMGMPAWERQALPLVFCGDTLAAAAGIGIDTAFQAAPGHAGVTIAWHPDPTGLLQNPTPVDTKRVP